MQTTRRRVLPDPNRRSPKPGFIVAEHGHTHSQLNYVSFSRRLRPRLTLPAVPLGPIPQQDPPSRRLRPCNPKPKPRMVNPRHNRDRTLKRRYPPPRRRPMDTTPERRVPKHGGRRELFTCRFSIRTSPSCGIRIPRDVGDTA
jgi:hypothetical protein